MTALPISTPTTSTLKAERLMKAYVAANSLSDAADQAEKLASIEGTAKAYLRAASIRVHARQGQQARELLNRGIAMFPESADLRRAADELCEKSKAATV